MVVENPELGKKEASSLKNISRVTPAVAIVDGSRERPEAQKALEAPDTNIRWTTPVGSFLKTPRMTMSLLFEVSVRAA